MTSVDAKDLETSLSHQRSMIIETSYKERKGHTRDKSRKARFSRKELLRVDRCKGPPALLYNGTS